MTLGRWIKEQAAPAGFYFGSNTRAWFKTTGITGLPIGPRRTAGRGTPPEIKGGASAQQKEPGGQKQRSPQDIANPHPFANPPLMGGLAHDEGDLREAALSIIGRT